jgi:hypothetical protein
MDKIEKIVEELHKLDSSELLEVIDFIEKELIKDEDKRTKAP